MKKLFWLSTLGLAIAATSLPVVAQTPETQTPETQTPVTPIPETQTPGTQIPPTTPITQDSFGAPRIKHTSTSRTTNYISLYTGSQPLAYVTILPPENIGIGNNITVTDQSGQSINANVTREGQKVRISFAQPVAPGSTLEIALTDLAFGYPYPSKSTFNYELAGGHIGFNREIPYGLAQFQIY